MHDPAVGALALALRAVVRAEAPTANEFICAAYNAVAIAFSFTGKWQEGFCHITLYSRYANLGFQRGLDNPKGVLKGTGKLIRHIRIASAEELNRPQVRQYLRAAIKHTNQTAPKTKSAVKGASPTKRRPRP